MEVEFGEKKSLACRGKGLIAEGGGGSEASGDKDRRRGGRVDSEGRGAIEVGSASFFGPGDFSGGIEGEEKDILGSVGLEGGGTEGDGIGEVSGENDRLIVESERDSFVVLLSSEGEEPEGFASGVEFEEEDIFAAFAGVLVSAEIEGAFEESGGVEVLGGIGGEGEEADLIELGIGTEEREEPRAGGAAEAKAVGAS